MIEFDLVELAQILVWLITAVLLPLVGIVLRRLLSASTEQKQLLLLQSIAAQTVRAAAQLFTDNPARKQYAVDIVSTAAERIGLSITEDQVEMLVEAAVYWLKEVSKEESD